MGLISRILGAPAATAALAEAATTVAEVFTPNATRRMAAAQEAYLKALEEHAAEFRSAREGGFDRFVNGLNRLPRPFLAFGTIGLFVHAMADPEGFARRMAGLDAVPEPLWWLLAAVVGFYFGAREAHYFRTRPVLGIPSRSGAADPAPAAALPLMAAEPFEDNAALRDWAAATAAR